MTCLLIVASTLVMAQDLDSNPAGGLTVWSRSGVALNSAKADFTVGRLPLLKRGDRIYVSLRAMSTGRQPGVVYRLYLRGTSRAEALVGSINFFNLERSIDSVPGAVALDSRQFDVTDLVAKLSGPLTLSIRATEAPEANAGANIGRLEFMLIRSSMERKK